MKIVNEKNKYFLVKPNYFKKLKKQNGGKYVVKGKNLFITGPSETENIKDEIKQAASDLQKFEDMFNDALTSIFKFAKENNFKFKFKHVYEPTFYLQLRDNYSGKRGVYSEYSNEVLISNKFVYKGETFLSAEKDYIKNSVTHELLHMLFTSAKGYKLKNGTPKVVISATGANKVKNIVLTSSDDVANEEYTKNNNTSLIIDEMFTDYFAGKISGYNLSSKNNMEFCDSLSDKLIWKVLTNHKSELVVDKYLEFYEKFKQRDIAAEKQKQQQVLETKQEIKQ